MISIFLDVKIYTFTRIIDWNLQVVFGYGDFDMVFNIVPEVIIYMLWDECDGRENYMLNE